MSVFPNWQRFAVHQRNPYGCIATGYEMLLRAAGAEGIDFTTFQDEFDLDICWRPGIEPRNNFGSVADVISTLYPNVRFAQVAWPKGQGAEKLRFIEDRLAQKQPVLVSLALAPFGQGGHHIMPVVDMDERTLALFNGMDAQGRINLMRLAKADIVEIHDKYDGGWEVAYLERC